jgi:hypothetical protein
MLPIGSELLSDESAPLPSDDMSDALACLLTGVCSCSSLLGSCSPFKRSVKQKIKNPPLLMFDCFENKTQFQFLLHF